MESKSKTIPAIFAIVVVLIGVPLYFLHGATLEKKRNNAVNNAGEPWAPKAILDTAYLYGATAREPKAHEIYTQWLKMYAGDEVVRLCFPERGEEIDEFEDDNTHVFNPPRVSTAEPHPRTAEILMAYCYGLELRLNNGACRGVMAYILDESPENIPVEAKLKAEYEKFRGRLKTKTY